MAQQNNQSPSLPLWKRLLKEKSGTDLSANVAKYKYKDLAEDNLASLAEALEWLMDECQFIPKEVFTEQGKVNFQLSLIKAKEALNKIS